MIKMIKKCARKVQQTFCRHDWHCTSSGEHRVYFCRKCGKMMMEIRK